MANLQVTGIYHGFGRQLVLNGVHFSVVDGECAVLFGANGSGKSTLLTILSTRYRPRRGGFTLDGLDPMTNGEEVRGRLLLVGHHSHLYGHLSPLENLRFFMDLRGLSCSDATLLEAIATVGLDRFGLRPVKGFSAGMRKRVALARLLIAKPSLLLLDEPYTALDAAGIDWLNHTLAEFLRTGGSIVMATHDPERVAVLAPRSLRLVDGQLVPDGPKTC
ncbi:MAG: heme ABC exporter ATP-binding protein CcmA [Magnetococcus sp. DMHC-6]